MNKAEIAREYGLVNEGGEWYWDTSVFGKHAAQQKLINKFLELATAEPRPDAANDVLYVRCMKHRECEQLNANEASGAECPICALEESNLRWLAALGSKAKSIAFSGDVGAYVDAAINNLDEVDKILPDSLGRTLIQRIGLLLERANREAALSCEYSKASEPGREAFSDEQIDDMLTKLDVHAREVDNYDYGLPLSTEDFPKLREIVRESLASRASAALPQPTNVTKEPATLAREIVNGFCGAGNEPIGAYQLLEARLVAWRESIIEEVLKSSTCGSEFKLRYGYFCQLPKGHAGDHESECPNPQFHQSWPSAGSEGESNG